MSYAAGIDDHNPRYLDTQAGTVVAHPVFPVCLEWPVILSSRHLPGSESMTPAEGARGVHAAHDLHIYQADPRRRTPDNARDGDRSAADQTGRSANDPARYR